MLISNVANAQEVEGGPGINFWVDILGMKGILFLIGVLFFFFTYRNSVKLFQWIEDQTYGTRDYILGQLERCFIEVEPEKITYLLLFLSFGLSILAFGLCALAGSFGLGAFLAIVLSFIGWKIPRPIVDFMVQMRIKKFSLQMTDGLNLLSNGLRAGLSLPQAIGMVVDELPDPIAQEYNLVLQQNKIGVPLEECFEELKKRMPTEDNEMFVTSVNILRETGGNLAETFDTISEVIRERVRLQQKIDTYTAQGKFQGGTIFAMPFVMLLLFSASDPKSVEPLFTTTIGIIIFIVAVTLDLIGGFFILKVTKIKG